MIGLIFGETDFPKYIHKKIKGKKKYIIIDLTKKNFFKKDKNSFSFSIGQFGKIISTLKKNNCRKVLFAGKVDRPNFAEMKLDLKGIFHISRIIKKSKLGDSALLKEIINIFRKEKIKTVNSTIFTPELNLSKGIYTSLKPDKTSKIDIRKALNKLKKTNPLGHIQGAISRNNQVILEKKEGTRNLLKKIKKQKKINSGVLVKFPKVKQDLRIDLPTVGLETIKDCKAAGLKGIVMKHKKNVFLDKNKSIKYANKHKIFILVK